MVLRKCAPSGLPAPAVLPAQLNPWPVQFDTPVLMTR